MLAAAVVSSVTTSGGAIAGVLGLRAHSIRCVIPANAVLYSEGKKNTRA